MTTRRRALAALAAWGAGPLAARASEAATGAAPRDPSELDAAPPEAGRPPVAAPEAPPEPPSVRLAAAWDDAAGHRVGVLAAAPDGALRVEAALAVPTRAHGLLAEPGGSLLAVARRPGDWLLRFGRDGRRLREHWIGPEARFNGHLLASPDGRRLYSTETDLDSGAGRLGVRDAASLELLAHWPTHGLDPHELLWDADGSLLVANGGIPTQPETGRAKRGLERMDPSLVRLEPADGRLLGQWRLADPRLSVRHLARQGATTAIALQAEHDDAARRVAAPVLALFDGARLRLAGTPPRPMAGYGGSAAGAGGRFYVGCPRAGGTGCWRADGAWLGFAPLEEACALAARGGGVWSGGRDRAGWAEGPRDAAPGGAAAAGLRLDNHWIALG
jgi:hypothetical protein